MSDRRLLRLIRGFLTAGVLAQGLVGPTDEGTPQGGPLSPLLSNVVLDVLDKELEQRGHRFVRYADDCNIHVRNRRAVGLQPTGLTRGERVMASVASFLTDRLKLRLNAAQSAVDRPEHRKVVGFSFKIGPMPKRRIAPAALVRFKERVRDLTRRDCGNSLDTMTKSLARYLIGWRGYFGFSELPSELRRLDKWIRRRLRAIARKQWKRGRKRYKELRRRGVDHDRAARTAGSGHSPWRMALTPAMHLALPNAFFTALGLPSLVVRTA
jgi:RNA-directed DNA polymerase